MPLWPNFRPRIRQLDAAVADMVRARDTTTAGIYPPACFMTPHSLFGDGCIDLVTVCTPERRTV